MSEFDITRVENRIITPKKNSCLTVCL